MPQWWNEPQKTCYLCTKNHIMAFKKAFTILSLFLLWHTAYAQYNATILYDENSPLGTTEIVRILCDREGKIWIGTTSKGLHTFDGINFSQYPMENTESGTLTSQIYFLTQDRDGTIWTGDDQMGITTIKDNTLSQFPCRDNPTLPNELPKRVRIWTTAEHEIMIIRNNKLCQYDPKTNTFLPISDLPADDEKDYALNPYTKELYKSDQHNIYTFQNNQWKPIIQ